MTETGETEITVTEFPETRVPGFILSELEQDEKLSEAILEASGLDVLNPPSAPELARKAYDRVLAEYRELPYVNISYNLWEKDISFNGREYIMSTPRPGDPAHADTFSLRPADMGFELHDWQTGYLILILSPRNGNLVLTTTGLEDSLEYLRGYYHRR